METWPIYCTQCEYFPNFTVFFFQLYVPYLQRLTFSFLVENVYSMCQPTEF